MLYIEDSYIKVKIHNELNEKLIICFQGFDSHTLNKEYNLYFNKSPEKFGQGLSFYMENFSEKHTQFNYILVKDPLQCWWLNSYDNVLNSLQKILCNNKYKYLVTTGCSAGGTGAIIFGTKLNADHIYAFSPQISLLKNSINHPNINHLSRRNIIRSYVNYKNVNFDPISKLQPFKTNVTIYTTYRELDINEINILDKSDINLKINYINGTTHDIVMHMGGKEKFKELLLELFNSSY